MTAQRQFLDVIDRDEAERRFRQVLNLDPLEVECVPLAKALGRVLALPVRAPVNVPSFDRSNYDGYAVRAEDTYGADEETPRILVLTGESIPTAHVPECEVLNGYASTIATGGMLPRGADAVLMTEDADVVGENVQVRRPVTPGFGISFAGSDVTHGEIVLPARTLLASRDTGVLAAIGVSRVDVFRRPRVAILSTGDEIVEPGAPMVPGAVYDSNARILADAVTELGADPYLLGIFGDDLEALREVVREATKTYDVVILSGGTSKGEGDVSYRAVRDVARPGIVAHGVALKPGKPVCLAAHAGRPVVILPGFPTSAIFTFHEFLAPVIRRLGGLGTPPVRDCMARLPVKLNSQIGRSEYVLVSLVSGSQEDEGGLPVAFPMGSGSGSVTTFSRADGYVTVDRHQEIVPEGSIVRVRLMGASQSASDLVVLGSHCPGLDFLLDRLRQRGWSIKFLAVGSTAGLEAARRGECDLAGLHLLDAESGEYNRPFVGDDLHWIPGYGRRQGVVFRADDDRFGAANAVAAVRAAESRPEVRMVNRNRGSGTRILIDEILEGRQPEGYTLQARSHHAVATAIEQGRADWGVTIWPVARQSGLGFLPLRDEQFDFVVPRNRIGRQVIRDFLALLEQEDVREQIRSMGFESPGQGNEAMAGKLPE